MWHSPPVAPPTGHTEAISLPPSPSEMCFCSILSILQGRACAAAAVQLVHVRSKVICMSPLFSVSAVLLCSYVVKHLSISLHSLKKSLLITLFLLIVSSCQRLSYAALMLSYILRPPLSLSNMIFHLRCVCMPRCNNREIGKNMKILTRVQWAVSLGAIACLAAEPFCPENWTRELNCTEWS